MYCAPPYIGLLNDNKYSQEYVNIQNEKVCEI